MNSRRLSAVLAVLLAALAASAFVPARPGWRFAFPRDHGAHPAFKTEWWYYTGHLAARDGRTFGYQLTFFRVGVPPGRPVRGQASRWRASEVHLAHFAISDVGRRAFSFHERLQRGGVGLAWASADRLEVVNGTWSATLAGATHRLAARGGRDAIALALTSLKPPVIHGHDGVSRKSACSTCTSHYYSLTRLRTRGTLTLDGSPMPVEGLSWMDHEFGSNQLGESLEGWDWFSLQLANGAELMLYQLRQSDGTPVPESSGTYVRPDGSWVHLPRQAFQLEETGGWSSPRSNARYPMGWQVRVPGEALELTVTPAFEDQELRTGASTNETYWEGKVRAAGKQAGKPVSGQGYVELTGYAGPFKARI